MRAERGRPADGDGGPATTSAAGPPSSAAPSIGPPSQKSSPPPPNNIEVEQALLGSLLIDPVAFGRIGAEIDGSAFYSAANRHVFEAIAAVWRRGGAPDTVTVAAELERRDRLAKIGGAAYLAELVESVPSALNVGTYLRIVKDHARSRQMLDAAGLLGRAAYADGAKRDHLLERAQLMQTAIAGDVDELGWTLYTLEDAFAPRPPTEEIIEGLFKPGMLVIVYGAPSTLKTFLLLDAGLAVAGGLPWLPALPEHPGPPARQTVIAPVLWLDCDNGSERMHERVEAEARALGLEPGAVPFYYVSLPSPPFNAGVASSTEALIRQCKAISAGLVIIDNLGVVSGDADENSAEMARVMANLRHLAEEAGAAVVVVHHQRKSSGFKGRAGETLRGHSSIEAALDLALLAEREEDSDSITVKATKSRGAGVPPFGAVFTYDWREGTRELYKARFYGEIVEDKSATGRATRAIIGVLKASGEPLNKTKLTEAAYAATEGVAVNYIRRQIEILAEAGRLTVRPGPYNAQLYTVTED